MGGEEELGGVLVFADDGGGDKVTHSSRGCHGRGDPRRPSQGVITLSNLNPKQAGCKSSLTGEDFYGAYDAQDMAKANAAELGMQVSKETYVLVKRDLYTMRRTWPR